MALGHLFHYSHRPQLDHLRPAMSIAHSPKEGFAPRPTATPRSHAYGPILPPTIAVIIIQALDLPYRAVARMIYGHGDAQHSTDLKSRTRKHDVVDNDFICRDTSFTRLELESIQSHTILDLSIEYLVLCWVLVLRRLGVDADDVARPESCRLPIIWIAILLESLATIDESIPKRSLPLSSISVRRPKALV